MANSFNTSQTSITQTGTATPVFTASASTTLIKSIRVFHASATSTATLHITKYQGTRTAMGNTSVSANTLTDLINDVLPLSSGDVISVESTHQPTTVFVSYVENATSVSGQSIDVLTDVDISTTAPTNNQILVWNSSSSKFFPADQAGGAVDSVNGATGTVVLNLDDINDVSATSPSNGNVINWQTNAWVLDGRLTTLYDEFRGGSTSTVQNGASTDSTLQLTATTAKLKSGVTGIDITETSPGDVEIIVATDATGSTAFTAVHLDGTTTANIADLILNLGTNLKLENSSNVKTLLRPHPSNSQDTTVTLPQGNVTIATTAEIPVNVTDLADVTSAGSGAIITTAERTKLNGIAAGAEVNVNADWNAVSGDAQILNKPSLATVATTGSYTDLINQPTIPTNTNLGNANLTADNNRTYDVNGNSLLIDVNGGDFSITDSASSDTYLQVGTNVLQLGDGGMTIKTNGIFQATRGLEQDEANLNSDGDYGSGAEITYLGASATSTLVGRLYYYDGTTWTAFTCATEAPQKALVGIAAGSTMASGFILKGFINPDATSLTAGQQVFGSTNATITSTAPGTTQFQRVLGHAISTTVIYFNPSQEYIQIA